MLVGAIVIADDMHIQVVGQLFVDLGHELLEFHALVSTVGGGDYGLYGFQVGMAPSRPPPMSSIRSR